MLIEINMREVGCMINDMDNEFEYHQNEENILENGRMISGFDSHFLIKI